MAIAPLLDTTGTADWSADLYGASWPRPRLRLVADRGWTEAETAAAAGDAPLPSEPGRPSRAVSSRVRTGEDVARRQARRAAVQRRRRAVVLAAVAAGVICGLSLPLAALGGLPAAAHPEPQAAVAGETVYEVRPGDTLWSIAERFDRGGDTRALVEALAREIGSAVVVPGERVRIP